MAYSLEFQAYVDGLGIKLTSLRKAVLSLLWGMKKPLKAYEILTDLLKTKPNATPPTVYRALDFFVAQGVVHKIESIQSYTLCTEPTNPLASEVLMVCDHCHAVVEAFDPVVGDLLTRLAKTHHFALKDDAIELKGCCNGCRLEIDITTNR